MLWNRRLATLALGLALLVVALGGWTRLNDAGLGCPDWPGCYGQLTVPMAEQQLQQAEALYPHAPVDIHKGWLEMVHRYAAGILGLLVMALAVMAWKQRAVAHYPWRATLALAGLIIVQALFGMWTVTLKLLPLVVTLHLLGGLLTLSLLFCLRMRLQHLAADSVPVRSTSEVVAGRRWVMAGLLLLFLQLAMGGWTSSNYAGWACTDWLQCNPQSEIEPDFGAAFELFPGVGANYEGGHLPVEARAAIQISHRVVALLLLGYVALLYWRFAGRSATGSAVGWVGLLTLVQAVLGIANVKLALPLALATAHHLGAVALLVAMLWLYERVGKETQEVGHGKNA
ncbi:COX15/CtaA family protein [Marinobacterium sp. CAU 1594]|nr:COX15/CtaA family protein [Marinobacterium arenosum]